MIESGKVAIIHYVLKVDGNVRDSSRGKPPLPYLHGHGNLVPGLEKALEGKAPGDTLSVELPPADAYGERTGPGPQRLPKKELPDGLDVREGARFQVPGPDDEPVVLWVVEEKGRFAWVDMEHPLVGKTLHFEVEVVDVRDALPDEIQHGHAHGLRGHAGHG